MYQPADVQSDFTLLAGKYPAYPTLAAEWNVIGGALMTDRTTHDLTIETPPAALAPGPTKTSFTNETLLIINKAKAGNLMPTVIAAALGAVLSAVAPPPAVQTAPTIAGSPPTVGTTFTSTTGTWSGSPTFTRQWLRNGGTIAGATQPTYTSAAADGGTNLSCRVTATNANGSTAATSNAIAVAA